MDRGSETTYTAVQNEDVLRFSIERNNTENGFIFGTYTVDKDGNILQSKTLGTVTQTGEIGKDVEKIAIDPENPDYDYNVDSVYSDAFNARDLVGVWVQEINSIDPVTKEITYKDMIYYSQNELTVKENAGFLPVFSFINSDNIVSASCLLK